MMKLFFKPAIKILNRLKYLQKFLLIGAIFIIPLGVVMFFFISEINSKIQFAQKERQGVEYISLAANLLQRTIQYAVPFSLSYENEASFEQRLGNLKEQINHDIRMLDILDSRLGTILAIGQDWKELKSQWQEFKGPAQDLGSLEIQNVYHALHRGLLSLIIKAGETSNLILDPDLDSYYLMDTIVNKLPMAVDQLDELRVKGIRLVTQKKIESENEKLLLSSLYGRLDITLMLTQQGLKTALKDNPALIPQLEKDVQEGMGVSISFLRTLDARLINTESISISPADYYAGFTQAIDTAFALQREVSMCLDDLLQRRIDRFKLRRVFVEWLALVMLIGVVYFTIAFYLSVKNTVSQLDAVAENLSQDRPILEITSENKDELGEITKSFNKIGIKLRESYMQLEAINEELEEDILQRSLAEEEVKTLNRELENRVKERTAELDKVNEELKRDIIRRKQIERKLWIQYSIIRLLTEGKTLREVSLRVLEIVCDSLNYDLGIVWRLDSDSRALRCVEVWQAPGVDVFEFEKISRETAFIKGVGLPGRIWMNNAPAWIEDVTEDKNFPRAPFALKAGLHGAFGFPIRIDNEVQGVFEFFSRQLRQPDAELLQMFDAISEQVANFIKRVQAEEEIRKLSRSVEQSPISVVITDTLGNIEYVNPKFVQLTGWTPEEVRGKNLRILKSGEMSQEIYRQLWETITAGKEWRGELRNKKKNGDLYWEFVSISPLISNAGTPSHFIAVKEDITLRKQTEQRLAVQYAVTRILAGALSLNQVASEILQIVCETLGWDVGEIWIIDHNTQALKNMIIWHVAGMEISEFEEVTREITFPVGVGMPGRIRMSNAPAWIEDVSADKNFLRADIALKSGLHGAFGFPIRIDNEVEGTLEFFSRHLRPPDDALLAMFDSIGDQIGHLIKRTRAEEELRQLNQNLELRIYQRTNELENSYKQLHEVNELSKLLLRTIPFGMDIVDEEGNTLFLSERFQEYFGNDALGRKCWMLYKDNQQQCADCPLKNPLGLGETGVVEVAGVMGGRIFQISHTGMIYKNKKAVLEIFEDITERRRAEQKVGLFSNIAIAITEAEDMNSAFKIVLEGVGEAIGWLYGEMWVPSAGRVYLECSPSYYMRNQNLMKFRESSIGVRFLPGIGLPGRAWVLKKLALIRDISEDSNFSRHEAALAAGLKRGIAIPITTGEEVVSVMTFFTSEINEAPDIEQILSAVALQLGSVLRRKQVEEELKKAYNELKQAQSQLVQSAKMASVGQLAGGVAHEINNPLTGVLNNVQLIKMELAERGDIPAESFKQILDVIEESALRCAKITRSLLDFSHAAKESFYPLSVNEMVEKVVILIGHEMKLQNIVIIQELEPNIPQVYGDSQLLQQVIFDMVSNSRWAIHERASAQECLITIKTAYESAKNKVCLFISDNGIGIPEENLPRIFDPFFTTKSVGEGTGLGLAIVYGIVKQHKGDIEVKSRVGEGATFKISLPAFLNLP